MIRTESGFTLNQDKTRWDKAAPSMTIVIDDVLDKDGNDGGVRLVAASATIQVAETVTWMLTNEGVLGVPRKAMLDELQAGGMERASADTELNRELGRRYAKGTVKKRGNTRCMTYWLTTHAPADAI
jgi:hypothetical protein